MQGTQQDALAKNVVWRAVNSTGTDHPDYLAPPKLAAWMKDKKAPATHTLMDEDGKIGKAYGARTKPHLYIVDGKGSLSELAGGKPVSNGVTRPYGCSVKYKS